jgi:hypothetical protein
MQMDNGGEHGSKGESVTKPNETETGDTNTENKEPAQTENVND